MVFAEVIQGHLKVRAEVWICAKNYEQNVQAPLWERVAATWGAPTLKPQLRGCVDPVPGLQQLVQTMCTPNDAHRPTATEVRRTLERLNFAGLQECPTTWIQNWTSKWSLHRDLSRTVSWMQKWAVCRMQKTQRSCQTVVNIILS